MAIHPCQCTRRAPRLRRHVRIIRECGGGLTWGWRGLRERPAWRVAAGQGECGDEPKCNFHGATQSYARRRPTSPALKTGFRGAGQRSAARPGDMPSRPPRPARSTYRQDWFPVGFRPRIATAREANPDSARIVPVKRDGRPRRSNGRPLSARGPQDRVDRTPLWERALTAPCPRARSAASKSINWPGLGAQARPRRRPQGRLSLEERGKTQTRL
jgi:hypothetical protein